MNRGASDAFLAIFGYRPVRPEDPPMPAPAPVPDPAEVTVSPDDPTVRDAPGDYFTWAEFEGGKAAAQVGGITVAPEHRGNVRQLCRHVLDPLRRGIGRAIRITGGYRTPETNRMIEGSKNSQHMRGEAADIKSPGIKAEDLARAIVRFCPDFDQVIWYDEARGGHVHVSYTTSRSNRGQTLHAPASGGYVAWKP